MKITIEVPDQFVGDLEDLIGTQPMFVPGVDMQVLESLSLEEKLKAKYENEIDQHIISRRTQDANESARQEVVDARDVLNETVAAPVVAAKAPIVTPVTTGTTDSSK